MVVVALKGLSFIIGIAIIGVFFYIITLQKINHVGILKAIGASNYYVFKDLVVQICFLSLIGITIGTVLAYCACQVIPPMISLSLSAGSMLSNVIGVFVMSFLGALFSLRHIVKVDPNIALNQPY